MKYKIKKTILICLIFFSTIEKCYADGASISVPSFTPSTGQTSSDGPPKNSMSWSEVSGDTTYNYTCEWTYNISSSHNTTVYGYNQEDRAIINGNVTPVEKIKSGTAIGMKITETTTVRGSVVSTNLTATKITKTTNTICTKKHVLCPPGNDGNGFILFENISWLKLPLLVVQRPGNCTTTWKSCIAGTSGCNCTSTTNTTTEAHTPTAADIAKCENEATKWVNNQVSQISIGKNYNVNILNSNDINITNPISLSATGGCNGSNPRTCSYSYGVNKTCINMKTARIRYTAENQCENDEFEIKKGNNNHWHYFVPLNAKNNDSFVITMSRANESGLKSGDFCEKAIEENKSNYYDFIRDSNFDKLTKNINRDKQIVKNGCYLGVEIEIPIEQKFYNEVEENEESIFKGFNFYYKPININNPFPNGLTDINSLWYNWYKNIKNGKKATPDLTKSFKNISYIADIKNPTSIRNDNKNNQYDDWSNMGIDGKSSFIGEGMNSIGVISRANVNIYKVYKLGCGASNKNRYNEDGNLNPLYQQECDVS